MVKNPPTANQTDETSKLMTVIKRHFDEGFEITEQRETGRKAIGRISFKEADELFRSWIQENNWPYDALLFDPRVFTFIFEKTSRLISNKPIRDTVIGWFPKKKKETKEVWQG